MQAPNPPVVLIFGPFDPTGASSLPADAVTFASLGCHALCAVTATLIGDTAHLEEIHPAAAELLDDQARCMLEDMAVKAIKVGQIYTTETVSAIAQIAADYSEVPLILHLGQLPDDSLLDDFDAEDVQAAVFELLLPQTDIVIVDHSLLQQWQADGLLAGTDAGTPSQVLLQYGVQWVLTCGAPLRPGQASYLLEGQNDETINWPWQPSAARLQDPEGPLACAITAQLGKGNTEMAVAVQEAIGISVPMAAHTFQPGMGQRLILRCSS